VSEQRKPVQHWRQIVGSWRFNGTKAEYLGPSPKSRVYGLCLSDLSFSRGDVQLEVAFPARAPDLSGRLLLSFQSEKHEYFVVGVGGYGHAYTLTRYDPAGIWSQVVGVGEENSLANQQGHRLEVRVDDRKVVLADGGITVLEHPLRAPLPSGPIGLYAWGSSPVKFANVSVSGPKIFIGHGHSRVWGDLRDYYR